MTPDPVTVSVDTHATKVDLFSGKMDSEQSLSYLGTVWKVLLLAGTC